MTRWLCAPMIMILLFAGCIDAANEVTDDSTENPTDALTFDDMQPIPWGLSECEAAVMLFDVDAEKVRPHLPEGFQPIPNTQGLTGVAADPLQQGSFGVEMFTCRSGVGLNETVDPIAYGSFFAFAKPPSAHADPDVDYQFVKWDTLIPDAPRRGMLEAIGAPVHNGSAAFTTYTLQGAVGEAAGSLEMNGTHRLEGRTAAPGPEQITFVEFMETTDGLIAWRTTAKTTAIGLGPGSYTPPAGSLGEAVLGSGASDGTLMLFKGSFTDGTITRL